MDASKPTFDTPQLSGVQPGKPPAPEPPGSMAHFHSLVASGKLSDILGRWAANGKRFK